VLANNTPDHTLALVTTLVRSTGLTVDIEDAARGDGTLGRGGQLAAVAGRSGRGFMVGSVAVVRLRGRVVELGRWCGRWSGRAA
jgi:hypothetical protein